MVLILLSLSSVFRSAYYPSDEEVARMVLDSNIGRSGQVEDHVSRVVRKPAFYICENKDADQLRGNREADQRLCFRYTDSTIPLLPTSEISRL